MTTVKPVSYTLQSVSFLMIIQRRRPCIVEWTGCSHSRQRKDNAMSTSQSADSNAPGQFDNTFGKEKNGTVRIHEQGIHGYSELLPNGELITLGPLLRAENRSVGSIRVKPDGTYKDFNPQSNITGHIFETVLQKDDKIVALGVYDSEKEEKAFIARFLPDGNSDINFGDNGVKYLDCTIFPKFHNNHGLALQEDGKIVAAFYTYLSSSVIVRLDSNGQLDAFGVNGIVTLPNTNINSLVIHRDGLVVGGFKKEGGEEYGVVLRYLSSGRPDPVFGDNGAFRLNVDANETPSIFALASEPDGKITMAGASRYLPSENNFVARLLPDGNFDGGFNNGKALETKSNLVYKAVVIQDDGKILTLARAQSVMVYVVRHERNGELDKTFGDQGTALAYRSPTGMDTSDVDKLQVQPDGKILVSGSIYNGSYIGRLHG
jgi:uncharacterized delta-60 repeat protein